MPKLIGGFFPFSFNLGENTVNRFLFLKKYEDERKVKPSNRTLLIINVPQFFNNECLVHLFRKFGPIASIDFKMKHTEEDETSNKSKFFDRHSLEPGCKVAYVVFMRTDSLKKVFEENDTKTVPENLFESNIGKNKFIDDYNNSFIDVQEVQNEIGTFMKEYDTALEEEKQKGKEKEGEPDKEGWITVSKHSRRKIPRIDAVNKKILETRIAGMSRKSLLTFYKNQLRDAKMNEILELRKNFEKDKAKIALMRSNRKFKPF